MGLKEYNAAVKKRKQALRQILLGKNIDSKKNQLFDPEGLKFFYQYLQEILYDEKIPTELDNPWRRNKWLVERFYGSIMRGLLNRKPEKLEKLKVKLVEIHKDYLELKIVNQGLVLEKKENVLSLLERFINHVSYSDSILCCLDIRMENLLFEISKGYEHFKLAVEKDKYVLPLFLVPFIKFCEVYKYYDHLENINLVIFEKKFWELIIRFQLPESDYFQDKKRRKESLLSKMKAKRVR